MSGMIQGDHAVSFVPRTGTVPDFFAVMREEVVKKSEPGPEAMKAVDELIALCRVFLSDNVHQVTGVTVDANGPILLLRNGQRIMLRHTGTRQVGDMLPPDYASAMIPTADSDLPRELRLQKQVKSRRS